MTSAKNQSKQEINTKGVLKCLENQEHLQYHFQIAKMLKDNRIIKNIIFVQICFFAITTSCFAQTLSKNERPLWELGLFNGIARLPHYRGSDEYKLYALPLPYLIYRGKVIQSDEYGIRGIFFKTKHLESSLSFWGNPPIGGDNRARKEMPDLDALFEIGPAIKWFFKDRGSLDYLYLSIALRGVSSANFDFGVDFAYQGLHGGLQLIYNNRSLFAQNNLEFDFSVGINFTDKDYNSYFYDVSSKYVLPERGFYESDGGYAGFSVSVSIKKKITQNLFLGGYSRWDNINGAVFDDSPLVKGKNNFVIGCALIWKIAESKRSAGSDESP